MVSDATGEPPVSVLISAVSSEEEGVVTCSDETRHNLETGDYVTFSEVQVKDEDTLVWCKLLRYLYCTSIIASYYIHVHVHVCLPH